MIAAFFCLCVWWSKYLWFWMVVSGFDWSFCPFWGPTLSLSTTFKWNCTGSDGYHILAFNPVGRHRIAWHLLTHCSQCCTEGGDFSGFLWNWAVWGWRGGMACRPGMNWLARRVPDRKTQMQEECSQGRQGSPMCYSTSHLFHVFTAWLVCASLFSLFTVPEEFRVQLAGKGTWEISSSARGWGKAAQETYSQHWQHK